MTKQASSEPPAEAEPDTPDSAPMDTNGPEPVAGASGPADDGEGTEPEAEAGGSDSETTNYSADYVRELRDEAAGHRARARTAEAEVTELKRELFRARVEASGRLIRAEDLPYSEELDTAEAVAEALDELLADRPYLGARAMPSAGPSGPSGAAEDDGALLGIIQRGA